MNKKTNSLAVAATVATLTLSSILFSGCDDSSEAASGISPQKMADALHLVMSSDRTVYTRNVVNRLTKQDKVITASEHWVDDKALPLPAQMFRMGAEMVAEKSNGEFSYSLQSLWPINKQNAPKTDAEKEGLQFIADNPGQNYYAEETLGGTKYFTGIYADTGVAAACIDCHNEHKDSPRTDFKMGEVMGGVVIRIPLD
ncbi:DUF3365 domain-containing protein [Pelagicoccus sp. SDUM812003]|uniref:Tll0287-like domain-containing protein n=1 Tax=Pelagicoccus sp. SDUM812003 TaxID=3041267 RepID=UPI0028102209|nr:DUF3365 domain-containing protein [Pelagicoccus sp. SDUM812003]MDQ8203708.1 DUF3365 domain-containing protein [Pelagicoccus sp. SDUM812003]